MLVDVSLTVGTRDRLAIVGANGAGKSTLLRSIVGLDRATSGRVELFGNTCTEEYQFRKFRSRIGFLFQDSDDQLFCPTVIEDVSFGPLNIGYTHSEAVERAHAALEELDISHLADRISHHLSGGEKRLVCLAGLLAMRPDVLLLDEPTNGVDAEHGQRLKNSLRTFPGAMLLVSHDDGLVSELASHAMAIHGGHLYASPA
nr:energy-coupling factor ABC transporter ATP-binding protein [Roseomonas sp. SXEYE001]